ncbi:MFS transporter [Rothia sp. LK2588]|uniref:MFS transporter n=1 Tax=Rothia sp. LK2588 TaxID=3114369 RepID=UPI0034CF5AF4
MPETKLLRMPVMVPVLATFALCIGGLSLLLPTSPAWVVLGGAGSTGAGLVTATLMAVTVATQLWVVQPMLNRFGWARTLAAGSLFMGLPAPLQALAPHLGLVLFSSGLRGVGFGILTVCCSTALSLLVPAHLRGRAIGYYGLAAAVPQLLLTPLAPWLIDHVGFRPVLIGGAITALGAPFAYRLGKLVDAHHESPVTGAQAMAAGERAPVLPRIWPALLTLTVSTAAGGGFMTFVTDVAGEPSRASSALLAMMVAAVPTRLFGGTLTDRWGTRITLAPVLAVNAVGVVLLGLAAAQGGASAAVLYGGALLTGCGYGFLQSVSMVRALNDAGPGNMTRASVAWNANFDIGTGLGGLAIGAMAAGLGFSGAWWVWAAVMTLSAAVIGTRDLRRTSRAS